MRKAEFKKTCRIGIINATSNREKLLHYLRMAMASEAQSVRVSAEKYGEAAGALLDWFDHLSEDSTDRHLIEDLLLLMPGDPTMERARILLKVVNFLMEN